MRLTQQQLDHFKYRLKNDDTLKAQMTSITSYLAASEYQVIQLMVHNNIWQGSVPPNPGTTGNVEFGLVPYWTYNPPSAIQHMINDSTIFKFIWDDAIEALVPKPQIDHTNYDALISMATSTGVVGADGTIFGESTYEQLDSGWFYAVLDYFTTVIFPLEVLPFPGDTPPQPQPISLSGSSAERVKIVLLGDWGTGLYTNGPAKTIMD